MEQIPVLHICLMEETALTQPELLHPSALFPRELTVTFAATHKVVIKLCVCKLSKEPQIGISATYPSTLIIMTFKVAATMLF